MLKTRLAQLPQGSMKIVHRHPGTCEATRSVGSPQARHTNVLDLQLSIQTTCKS